MTGNRSHFILKAKEDRITLLCQCITLPMSMCNITLLSHLDANSTLIQPSLLHFLSPLVLSFVYTTNCVAWP